MRPWEGGITLVTLATVILVSACQTVPATRSDPERAVVCKALQRSLAGDLDVGANIPLVGFKFKWNLPNTLSEERLVAVQDMLLHCALWQSHDISPEQFATAVDRATAVYASGRAEDIAAIQQRMDRVEAGLVGSGVEAKRAPAQVTFAAAEQIGAAPDRAAAMAAANLANGELVRDALNPLVERLLRQETAIGETDRRLAHLEAQRATDGSTPSAPARYVPGAPPLSVFFATGSDRLEQSGRTSLDRLAAWAVGAGAGITVQGFADEQGEPDLNRTLSLGRAEATAGYLRERGVQVIAVSGGGESTLFPGELAANRRVVVEAFVLR